MVWQRKQLATFELIKKFNVDPKLIDIFSKLKSAGYLIAVASNSIRETVKLSLLKIGVMEYVDYYVSNQDVVHPKPYPEMYWQCMTALKALPKNTLIIEDSPKGISAAIDSGAKISIGTHPHVMEDIEVYKNGFIAYSLGNFIFDQYFSKDTMEGMLLQIKLSKDGSMLVQKDTLQLNKIFQPDKIIKGKEEKIKFQETKQN